MSVKRTEDSLLKLNAYRKSSAPSQSGMSDDNKIRLQLALDIEHYSTQVGTCNSLVVSYMYDELSKTSITNMLQIVALTYIL